MPIQCYDVSVFTFYAHIEVKYLLKCKNKIIYNFNNTIKLYVSSRFYVHSHKW